MKLINIKSVLLALSVLALAAGSALGQEKGSAKGGASKLLFNQPVKTMAQAESLKPGRALAKVCTSCQTVVICHVTEGSKAHCDLVDGKCDSCGKDTVFCCATKDKTAK